MATHAPKPGDGFSKGKAPNKGTLQKDLQKYKQMAGEMSEHLGQMGQYCAAMMKAHYDVLGVIVRLQKNTGISLAIGLSAKQADLIRTKLELIANTIVDYAADHRMNQEPGFAKADTSHLVKIGDVPMTCPHCRWDGTIGDCVPNVDEEGSLGCPKCKRIVTETRKPDEDTETEEKPEDAG